MAGVGAVKELSGITDNIIDKIDELEQVRVISLGINASLPLPMKLVYCMRPNKYIYIL